MPIIATTIKEWDAEIQKQSLHLKFDGQLEQMLQSHTNKIPVALKALNDILRFPDAKRLEIYNSLVESGEIVGLPDDITEVPPEIKTKIDAELQPKLNYYQNKWQMLSDICTLIEKEKELRAAGQVLRVPLGTIYYIDLDAGDDVKDGLTTGNAWRTLDKFSANARNAGDKAIVRRATGGLEATTNLFFTSNGDIENPIIIEADYDDDWGDETIAGQTATLIFGSKTVTFAADISGDIAAGDWIYEATEDNREFAYEVASVTGGSNEIVTLFIPYKGAISGAGKTINIMPPNPIWNTAAGDWKLFFGDDDYWKLQGLHLRGNEVDGIVNIDGGMGQLFKDCIFEGDGSGSYCIRFTCECGAVIGRKCRFYNYTTAIYMTALLGSCRVLMIDSLFDTGSRGSNNHTCGPWYFLDCEFKNHTTGDINFISSDGPQYVYTRNCLLSSATEVDRHQDSLFGMMFSEDHDQTVGDNRQLTWASTAEGTPSIQSDTTDVRPGGGTTSIKVAPSDKLSANWEFSKILIFEYPIYAVKDVAKTYTVYFKSDDDTDWDADPLATELWIEAEYWGHATNVARRILKSTGVCNNFDTDDTVWDSLTVTVTPLQTGVLYLRGYYCKTKEVGKSNIFFCDTKIGVA